MDAVDPALVDEIEHLIGHVDGVERVDALRVRWVGHELHAEMAVVLAGAPTLEASQQTVASLRRALLKGVRHLSVITVETVPAHSPRA
jgi:divalent metal cation (Fe/Co/Zn/Cd) transporter